MSINPTDADRSELGLAPLPERVLQLLAAEKAPPRLVAHLTLVHDVAGRLVRRVRKKWPRLIFDADAICFGAATHDIGKARVPSELAAPGKTHEAIGEQLLLAHGTDAYLARFARTHGSSDVVSLALEDLLVILADTAWKAKRDQALDDALAKAISTQTKQAVWEVFMTLDSIVADIAETADERLQWQARFPT